jgi:hypothetical protein
MKHLKTTIFGALAGLTALLHSQGVTIGHIGSGDVVGLFQSVFMALTGYYAADSTKVQ